MHDQVTYRFPPVATMTAGQQWTKNFRSKELSSSQGFGNVEARFDQMAERQLIANDGFAGHFLPGSMIAKFIPAEFRF
jgi:hypothetical protein